MSVHVALALGAALLVACAPSGQILLYVDTDAPVPPAVGAAFDPQRPPWLFDRLRVEIIEGGTISAARDFPIDEQMLRDRRVSLGIAPPIGDDGLIARVRLFRADRVVHGEPPPSSTLDTRVQLPAIGRSTRVSLGIVLHVDDVGVPVGADAAILPTPGPPGGSEVGSWPGAARVPCSGDPMPDEVCVAGGAFWFGDPSSIILLDSPQTERLVVVSPYFIDRSEVTVGSFRPQWATLGGKYAPSRRDPTQAFTSAKTWCTWSDAPGEVEALPLNCVPYDVAQRYCQARGRELVTEVQYERAASGAGLERRYPWGNDEPTCADAIWGLGGGGGLDSANPGDNSCLPSATLGGVAPPGSGARDRIAFGDAGSNAEVVDLAGNVAELMRDAFRTFDDGVWITPGVLRDPVQPFESSFDGGVARGGDFHNAVYTLHAAYRQQVPPMATSVGVGFRCSRAATAP